MSQNPHPHDPFGAEHGASVPEQSADPEIAQADGQSYPDAQQTPHAPDLAGQQQETTQADGTGPEVPQHPDAPRYSEGEQFETASPPSSGDVASPTSDPAQHPHDPYAYTAADPAAGGGEPQVGSATAPAPGGGSGAPVSGDPYAAPAGAPQQTGAEQQDPYGAPQNASGHGAGQQDPFGAAQQGPYGPGQHGQQPYGSGPPTAAYGAGQPYGAHGPAGQHTPPPGFKGVYDGPLRGEPLQDSDARTWSLVVHLAALLQIVIPLIGGLIAQIVLFAVFKDRSRFVRYNSAEALNGTIAALALSLVMVIVFGILTIITLGLGSFLFSLMFIPVTVQAIFAIIAAVKAYQGIWWNYPVNLRLVK